VPSAYIRLAVVGMAQQARVIQAGLRVIVESVPQTAKEFTTEHSQARPLGGEFLPLPWFIPGTGGRRWAYGGRADMNLMRLTVNVMEFFVTEAEPRQCAA
jgi:hypothetical protein